MSSRSSLSSKGENTKAFDKVTADNIFDTLNKIYLVAMYIGINSICTLENLVRYKRQKSALLRNTRSYYRCIRLKV